MKQIIRLMITCNILILLSVLFGTGHCFADDKATDRTAEKMKELMGMKPSIKKAVDVLDKFKNEIYKQSVKLQQVESESVKLLGLTAADRGRMVKTADAVMAPFLPDNMSKCGISKEISGKIRSDPNWRPEGLSALITRISSTDIYLFNQASINVLIHTIEYENGNDKRTLLVMGADTYKNFNPTPFIDTTRDNFSYNLDCSGYFNATVGLKTSWGFGDVRTSAETAMKARQSSAIVRAFVFPPIVVALLPEKVPPDLSKALNRRNRIQLLYSLDAELPKDAPDTAKIVSSRLVDVLWTSNTGDSSLQGEASFKAAAGGALGFVSADVNSSAGGSIGRHSNYGFFNTYLIDSHVTPSIDPITVADMRAALQSEVKRTEVVSGPKKSGDKQYTISLDLPELLCSNTTWTIDKLGPGNQNFSGNVISAKFNSNNCDIEVRFDAEETVKNAGGFKLVGSNKKLRFEHPIMFL
jgi:hypothetical protein